MQAVGVSRQTANLVDAGIGIVGSMGAGAANASAKVAAIAASDEAAGMTTYQIVRAWEKGSKALPDEVFDSLGGLKTSALHKAQMIEAGFPGTQGLNLWKALGLVPTGPTPLADVGLGVLGAGLRGTAGAIDYAGSGK